MLPEIIEVAIVGWGSEAPKVVGPILRQVRIIAAVGYSTAAIAVAG